MEVNIGNTKTDFGIIFNANSYLFGNDPSVWIHGTQWNGPVQFPNGATSISIADSTIYNRPFSIPNSVTSLGRFLSGCKEFNQPVDLPEGITNASYIFQGTEKFNRIVEFPDSVTTCAYAFYSSFFNSPVQFSPNTTNLRGTFAYSKFNQSVEIPEKVTTVANMFEASPFNKSISFPDSVVNMAGTFSSSEFNTDVNLANNVENISEIFAGSLFGKDIIIPASVKNSYGAFAGLSSAQNVTFRNFSNISNYARMFYVKRYSSNIHIHTSYEYELVQNATNLFYTTGSGSSSQVTPVWEVDTRDRCLYNSVYRISLFDPALNGVIPLETDDLKYFTYEISGADVLLTGLNSEAISADMVSTLFANSRMNGYNVKLKGFSVVDDLNLNLAFQTNYNFSSLDSGFFFNIKANYFNGYVNVPGGTKRVDIISTYFNNRITFPNNFDGTVSFRDCGMFDFEMIFPNAGNYQIKFNNCSSLKNDKTFLFLNLQRGVYSAMYNRCNGLKGTVAIPNDAIQTDSMFFNCQGNITGTTDYHLSSITNTSYMFYNCQNLTGDIFNTTVGANIVNASFMFFNCKNFSQNIYINHPNLINMSCMFRGCDIFSGTVNLNAYAQNANMSFAFFNCQNLTGKNSNFDLRNAGSTDYMFYDCKNLTNVIDGFTGISLYDSNDTSHMFDNCLNLIDVQEIYIPNAIDTHNMFSNCKSANHYEWSAGPTYYFPNSINTNGMFYMCQNIGAIYEINMESSNDAAYMFYNCVNFNCKKPIYMNNCNVSTSMFFNCRNFNQKVYCYNTHYITFMFMNCYNFNQSVLVNNVYAMQNAFRNCRNLNQPIEILNIYGEISGANVFRDCWNFNQPVNVSKFSSCNYMFFNCGNLNQDFYFNKCTFLNSAFTLCNNLRSNIYIDAANLLVAPNLFSTRPMLNGLYITNLSKTAAFSAIFPKDVIIEQGTEPRTGLIPIHTDKSSINYFIHTPIIVGNITPDWASGDSVLESYKNDYYNYSVIADIGVYNWVDYCNNYDIKNGYVEGINYSKIEEDGVTQLYMSNVYNGNNVYLRSSDYPPNRIWLNFDDNVDLLLEKNVVSSYGVLDFRAISQNWSGNISMPNNSDLFISHCDNFNGKISADVVNGITLEYCNNFNTEINFSSVKFLGINYCSNFNQPVNLYNVIPTTGGAYSGHASFNCSNNFNQPIVIPNTWTSCSRMMTGCQNFNSSFVFEENSIVNYMYATFDSCSNFNQSITIPKSVKNCSEAFARCSKLNSVINFESNSEVTDLNYAFYWADSFNQPITIPGSALNMVSMFQDCMAFNQSVTVTNPNANVCRMFQECFALNQPIIIYYLNNSDRYTGLLTGIGRSAKKPLTIYTKSFNMVGSSKLASGLTDDGWTTITNGYYQNNLYVYTNA